MTEDQKAQLYAEAERIQTKTAQRDMSLGQVGCNTTPAVDYDYRPPSLQAQLEKRVAHAQQEVRRAAKSAELIGLLDNHPEVARILDLVRELGV